MIVVSSIWARLKSHLWWWCVVVVLPEVIACAYATGSDVSGHDRKWHHRKSRDRNYALRMCNRFPRFFLTIVTLYDRWCISPFLAVTILHKIHYSIEIREKKKPKRIIGFQNIIGFFIITLWELRRRWWWWWRRWWWWQRHVRGLISTWLFWGPVGHHNLRKVCYRKWRHWKLRWPCNYGHLSFQLRSY